MSNSSELRLTRSLRLWGAAGRVLLRNALVWRKYLLSSLVGSLGQPFMFLLAFGFGMEQQIPVVAGYSYLQFIAPGLVVSAVMFSAAFETTYGSYTRLSTQSTFEGILMTPISVAELACGEVLWGASKGLLSGLIMLLALPLFGVWPSPWTILLLPLLFLDGIFFAAFGLIMTAVARNYEFFNYFISLILTPLYLFSGIFFAVENMSPLAQRFLAFLPLTPVVTLARMLCFGRFEEPWLLKVVGQIVLATISTWLAALLLRRRLIQ